jgi:hypothetical protein
MEPGALSVLGWLKLPEELVRQLRSLYLCSSVRHFSRTCLNISLSVEYLEIGAKLISRLAKELNSFCQPRSTRLSSGVALGLAASGLEEIPD